MLLRKCVSVSVQWWSHIVSGCPGYDTQPLSSAWITKVKKITSFSNIYVIKSEKWQQESFPSWYTLAMTFLFHPSSASRQRLGQSEGPGSGLAQLHCSSEQCTKHRGNIQIRPRPPKSSWREFLSTWFLYPNFFQKEAFFRVLT